LVRPRKSDALPLFHPLACSFFLRLRSILTKYYTLPLTPRHDDLCSMHQASCGAWGAARGCPRPEQSRGHLSRIFVCSLICLLRLCYVKCKALRPSASFALSEFTLSIAPCPTTKGAQKGQERLYVKYDIMSIDFYWP
jgi:hypothetical protein